MDPFDVNVTFLPLFNEYQSVSISWSGLSTLKVGDSEPNTSFGLGKLIFIVGAVVSGVGPSSHIG
ncbi:hypothetical protein ES705_11582 [subsurface metagenome]